MLVAFIHYFMRIIWTWSESIANSHMNVNGQRNGNYHKSITITDRLRSKISNGQISVTVEEEVSVTLYETQTVKVAPRHVSLLEAMFSLKFFLLSHVFLMFKLKNPWTRIMWSVLEFLLFFWLILFIVYQVHWFTDHGSPFWSQYIL